MVQGEFDGVLQIEFFEGFGYKCAGIGRFCPFEMLIIGVGGEVDDRQGLLV